MFRKQFSRRLAKSEATLKANPLHYHGWDWWQLSEEEEKVFEIDRARWPLMIEAWIAYEAFKKINTDVYDGAAVEDARANNPDWCGERVGFDEFGDFAKKLAELTFREAHATYTRQEFWCVRHGATVYADERKAAAEG